MQKDNNTPHINVDFFEDLTGDISKASGKGVEAIGERVKRLREEKGLTLDELSNLTGFEVEFLKRIENNEVKPQLGTIMRLSKALDSAFGRLVSGVGNKLYSITRKNEQKIISRSTSKKGRQKAYTYKSLAPEVQGRHMEALIVQLETLSEPEPSFHDGEEFIYVMEGTVSLRIGEDSFDLEPGDSAYYLSTTPHIIMAKEGSATIIAVLYQQ
jgi:transcriptional regulator with XRE-family HTH domain